MSVAYATIPSGHGEINGATGEPGTGRGHRPMPCVCGRKRNLRKASTSQGVLQAEQYLLLMDLA